MSVIPNKPNGVPPAMTLIGQWCHGTSVNTGTNTGHPAIMELALVLRHVE